jgi:hypothetical protein
MSLELKKTVIISSLIVVFAVPVAFFLFLVFFCPPSIGSKIVELCRVIDLRENLPAGRFQKVSIVLPINKNYEEVIFEVPPDKMAEFEAGFRKYVQNAMPLNTPLSGGIYELRIKAEKGKYSAYINYYDNTVTINGDYFHRGFRSKELRKVFYDAGLKYNLEYKYSLPSKEQVVAILLYPPKFSPPLAIFGDKKLAEKLLLETEFPDDPNGIQGAGKLYKFARLRKFGVETKIEGREIIIDNELKPKMVFEGRDWLEKIMDAYEVALKEAEQREKYYPGGPETFNARIVFMTRDNDYWKKIAISENVVYDDYIKSERLKECFDELGLTKELLQKNQTKRFGID